MKCKINKNGTVTVSLNGLTRTRPYGQCYEYRRHSEDARIPKEEGWRIAVWPDGRALACHPVSKHIDHSLALSSYEVALDFLLEIYRDNRN